jgi:hypothetical protein
MAYTVNWSYGRSVIQLSEPTVATEWSYGRSLLIFAFAVRPGRLRSAHTWVAATMKRRGRF